MRLQLQPATLLPAPSPAASSSASPLLCVQCLTDDFNIDFEDDTEVTEVSKLIQDV